MPRPQLRWIDQQSSRGRSRGSKPGLTLAVDDVDHDDDDDLYADDDHGGHDNNIKSDATSHQNSVISRISDIAEDFSTFVSDARTHRQWQEP
jgi:hypothetical protein